VLRALRGNPRTSSAPVVVLSSAADARDVMQSYQFGANSCVRKPVDFGEFNRVLQALAHYWLALNEAPTAPAAR
jgi:CheY-like chemotaxis protein